MSITDRDPCELEVGITGAVTPMENDDVSSQLLSATSIDTSSNSQEIITVWVHAVSYLMKSHQLIQTVEH